MSQFVLVMLVTILCGLVLNRSFSCSEKYFICL